MDIIKKHISEEIEQSYLTYSLSVIIGRAIPDVRDGLKPVHRRILYSMWEMGLTSEKPTKKCARIVGDVLGKFHPHGDMAVYDALVRMAQDFSLRYPLVYGQGNFGSIDGDTAAAMRYTEAKLNKISSKLLEDLDKETVNFVNNFDDSLKEPEVLPANFPNLLVNGSEGIAVGMTTSIPPHNIREVIEAIIHLIDNPDTQIEDLLKFIKGPDFPTAGFIVDNEGLYETYKKGRGKILVRGKARIEKIDNAKYIIIEEIPYQVNKAELIKRIAALVKNDVIEGISDLRDESDQNGIRVVIKLKSNAKPKVVLNKLYKHTNLQKYYYSNFVAIKDNQPYVFNLKDLLNEYYLFKKEIVVKRFNYLLKKAKHRKLILEGLVIALDNIDEVISIIKKSKNAKDAKINLIARFDFKDEQAQAILDMRLQRLTSLEIDRIKEEYKKILKEIEKMETILSSDKNIDIQIKKELLAIKETYQDARRTKVVQLTEDEDIDLVIIPEDMVVIMTKNGYIKRIPANKFFIQNRGGKGRRGVTLSSQDSVKFIIKCNTVDTMIFFTNKGKSYSVIVNDIIEGSFYSKGDLIDNYISLEQDETIKNIEVVKNFEENKSIIFVTKKGIIKRIELKSLKNSMRKSGLKYAILRENDDIVDSVIVNEENEVIIGTKFGKGLRFKAKDLRIQGRNSIGVKGIKLKNNDQVVSMIKIIPEMDILIATDEGYAKKVRYTDFPLQKRGGLGVNIISDVKKAGNILILKNVEKNSKILVITNDGKTIKIDTSSIKIQKRNTKGVKIIRLNPGSKVTDLTFA